METKEKTNASHKMTKVQKVIVILTAVVLTTILIVVASTQYMGSAVTYFVSTPPDSALTVEPTEGTLKNTVSNDNGQENTTEDAGTSDESSDVEDAQNTSTGTQNGTVKQPGNADQSGSHNSTADQGGENIELPKEEKTEPNQESSNEGGSEDGTGTDSSENENNQEDNDNDTGAPQVGIQTGDAVTVLAIGESTVTVKVGSETVVIPVQTMVFNGRITKSGVISDSLCGYYIGASVLLYYPEGGSLAGITISGAYVKVDSTRLTVSGDYNGEESKIVFRINGTKLP